MKWTEAIKVYEVYLLYEKSLSRTLFLANKENVKMFALYCSNKGLDVEDVKEEDVRGFARTLEESGKEEIRRNSIFLDVSIFLKYMQEDGVIKNDLTFLTNVERPRFKDLKIVSEKEVKHILGAVNVEEENGYMDRAILEMLYDCGMKITELPDMEFKNLWDKYGLVEIVGENGRYVEISLRLRSSIKEYNKKLRDLVKPAKGNEDLIFINGNGAKFTNMEVFEILEKYAKKVGLEDKVGIHTLRDSKIVHMIRSGVNMEDIDIYLGTNAGSWRNIYWEYAWGIKKYS